MIVQFLLVALTPLLRREERKRLAARIAAQGAKGHNSDQHTNSQSIEHAGEDTGQGWASGSGMGRGVLGEHAASDRDVLPTPPPSPILADAVTVRWLQADLANSTAPAAVHNEVGSRSFAYSSQEFFPTR